MKTRNFQTIQNQGFCGPKNSESNRIFSAFKLLKNGGEVQI